MRRARARDIESARSPELPDLPTIAETGLPGYEFVAWFGVFAPGTTPPALVTRIGALLRPAMDSPRRANFCAFKALSRNFCRRISSVRR